MNNSIYLNWKEYYKEIYLKNYNTTFQIEFNNKNFNDIHQIYLNLYNSALNLIKIFLAFNGIYRTTERKIIRAAFRYTLIEDGESWIELEDLMSNSNDKNFESGIKYMYNCLNIFTDLKNKFDSLLEEHA